MHRTTAITVGLFAAWACREDSACGTLADVQVAQTMWQTGRLRGGKLESWAFFRTEHEAVEAAGPRQ
jgi:hypothetical protein